MSEQRPKAEWIFPPERPRRGRRIALVITLVVAALLVAGLIVFLLFPRSSAIPDPTSSPSPSPTATRTPTPTVSPTATPLPTTPEPTAPQTEPPAPADPDVETFRGQVAPRLDDALVGLDLLAGKSGQEAVDIVDQLQQDAQRLSDAQPPSSIAERWRAAISAYAADLTTLRTSASGGDTAGEVGAVRGDIDGLRRILGA
ncbi:MULTISPECIES: hypothetical protein [Bacteria]|uniref:hypothetical protein n=1 Tax=Bacteria TaxID=2 RepID=UPI003C7A225E